MIRRHRSVAGCARMIAAALMISSLLFAWSCGNDRNIGRATADVAQPEEDGLTRTTEEGPVRATVTLGPASPRLGDRLTLTLTVEAEKGVVVEMPAFGEALGRFSIVDFTPRRQTAVDGSTIASQRYTLQAPMSGTQRVPPLRIEFLDRRTGQDDSGDRADDYRELLTDELTVDIASVLPEGTVLDQLRPVRDPLEEFPTSTLARDWPWLAVALVALTAFVVWFLRWRRRAAERARVTAFDRAMRRILALERRGLPSPDDADVWYVELSDIVRRYLEDRYAVRAPELTTEEFLQEARRAAELSAPHRDLLSSFLERCDRVKFAAYHPDDAESRQVLEAARRFLDETRVVPESPEDTMERTAA